MNTVTVVDTISREDFYRNFVKKNKPLLIKNQTREWAARELWTTDYFKNEKWNLEMIAKKGDVSKGNREQVKLADYIDNLIAYEKEKAKGTGKQLEKPAYLHDVPIFNLLPDLTKDIEPFPLELFPKWYWKNYQNYIQFFMGSSDSVTPLHFDTLCTHNMFFQMVGAKKFILIEAKQKDLCYLQRWRWSKIDASNVDYSEFPNAEKLNIQEVIVKGGDILYMPSGMLHQVHSLSFSISFNIDWHTAKSAASGILSKFKGAPWKNMYYNCLIFIGVALKIPSKYIFPYYKSYLNYVS
ncbi:cupin-like domain-containing protein [Tenacibaculum ovolyticum]|uniref:cupin-like domain-containing protein n=1 Tax=Tenacibaculum ovolyticum TaxID=104270 RepID=UPI0004039BCF|nr:cupin-like domain-containing protein [Tenacibaculum ovolyticum]